MRTLISWSSDFIPVGESALCYAERPAVRKKGSAACAGRRNGRIVLKWGAAFAASHACAPLPVTLWREESGSLWKTCGQDDELAEQVSSALENEYLRGLDRSPSPPPAPNCR